MEWRGMLGSKKAYYTSKVPIPSPLLGQQLSVGALTDLQTFVKHLELHYSSGHQAGDGSRRAGGKPTARLVSLPGKDGSSSTVHLSSCLSLTDGLLRDGVLRARPFLFRLCLCCSARAGSSPKKTVITHPNDDQWSDTLFHVKPVLLILREMLSLC